MTRCIPHARPASRSLEPTHGHRVEDPYAWMRDLEDPNALLAHLAAENAYAEARTAHLGPLRTDSRRSGRA